MQKRLTNIPNLAFNMVPVVRTLEKEYANCRYFLYTRLSRVKDGLETTLSKILFLPKQVLQLQ